MTEREEALRRFPPAEAKKLIPMTVPEAYKDYTPKPAWQMTRAEYYEPVTLPEGWKGKGYKPIIEKRKGRREYIVRIITPDGETLYSADHGIGAIWSRSRYKDDHRQKVEAALKQGLPVPREVLADYRDIAPSVAPQIYSSPTRKIKDRLEGIRTGNPDAIRELTEIRAEIKRRERGKIKSYPDISLTDLREIKKEAEELYL